MVKAITSKEFKVDTNEDEEEDIKDCLEKYYSYAKKTETQSFFFLTLLMYHYEIMTK